MHHYCLLCSRRCKPTGSERALRPHVLSWAGHQATLRNTSKRVLSRAQPYLARSVCWHLRALDCHCWPPSPASLSCFHLWMPASPPRWDSPWVLIISLSLNNVESQLKHRSLGFTGFWFNRLRWGPENQHFWQVSRWYWGCCLGTTLWEPLLGHGSWSVFLLWIPTV